ncbi:hypothetical protein MNEG_1116 [Monoraphidium neglectum]|uniref:Uncharacterized protein n=1 Tax=Monoraphidium neglectum TaxID=145388 RepID=A0A0D2LKB3_9CHLO|nr:hypothetical protein MNEG_1116 [Monoraphidium neglectum]KIZ06829.1 hypothetical protein MNEG_1116 [Monoraphidium neglectum]|eukprot:XP_013905848.1 hypothetical protein MNEG_1116 [Monoraphidium neglectum]
MVKVRYNGTASVRYRVKYARAYAGNATNRSQAALAGRVLVTNNGLSAAQVAGGLVRLFAVVAGDAAGGRPSSDTEIGTAACLVPTAGVAGAGGSVACAFDGVPLPPGTSKVYARADIEAGPFFSDPATPPAPSGGAPPPAPGDCAAAGDAFFEPQQDGPSGLVTPSGVAPAGAAVKAQGTSKYLGKAPDALGPPQKICGDGATFEYTASFGPFSPADCGTYAAVNLATAQRVLASGALEPDNAAASDLGILKIVVDGCPGRAPTAALDAPRLVVVQEHAWAMEGAAAPSTLLVRPGPGAASANITIKAKRTLLGKLYELSGSVVVRNPTRSSWRLGDVRLEAVRPGEIRTVLSQSASCPTDDNGDIILAPAGASGSTVTCSYVFQVNTPVAGVLTAVVVIADEIKPAKAGGSSSGGSGGDNAARAVRAAAPQAFTFLSDGLPRRSNGECASLFGGFAKSTWNSNATAAAASGALIEPNATSGSRVPPYEGPGQQLCQEQNALTFQASYKSLSDRKCNRYKIPLYHAQAGAAWSGLHAPRVLLQDGAQDEAGPSNSLPFPLGRAKAVAVQAKFMRDVVSQEWRLGGAIQISSPKPAPTQAGWPSVVLIFASGASARVLANCPPSATAPGGRGLLLPAAPGKVTCSWQLAKPQPGPLEGQAVAMLDGASPAAMSQITPFTSDGARPDTLGACAAVSASWALEGLPGGGGGGSSGGGGASGSADALLKVATSGGAPPAQGAEVCESKVYTWTLQLGPFKEAQCAAAAAGALKLAGSAAAQPLTGRTPKAAAAATARVALTGCPTAKVAG